MTAEVPAHRIAPSAASQRLTRAILDLAGRIPSSGEAPSTAPQQRAHAIADGAARRAALLAGGLALPPGPLGWVTVLPELSAIWQIQRRMVADIAAAHGMTADLTRAHMLHCLFRHAAAQAVRDLGVQVGARLLIQDVPLRVIERVATAVGLELGRRVAARGISRWLPAVGAIGVGAYAWYDTRQVARSAIELFGAAPAEAAAA